MIRITNPSGLYINLVSLVIRPKMTAQEEKREGRQETKIKVQFRYTDDQLKEFVNSSSRIMLDDVTENGVWLICDEEVRFITLTALEIMVEAINFKKANKKED
jgi:hypothetical protein